MTTSISPSASAPLIIIGAGLAGWTTVREFRKLDTSTPIVVVTADSGDFYAKPTLSNAYAQKRSPAQLVTTPAATMAETLQVTLRSHTQVLRMNPEAQSITLATEGAEETLTYRQLVLATGARPIRLPLQGDAAHAVRSINTLDDFAAFHSALGVDATEADSGQGKRVLIIGAGLIGCEFANDLAHAGMTLHVADPAAQPLASLLPASAGRQLQEALAGLGVQWHLGHSVTAVDHTETDALSATMSNGHTLRVDAVLSAVGLRADTALAQAAGLTCERGIVVDACLRTSAPQVFALGDCAQYASAGQRTLPYVMPIMNAAKALATTLVGTPTPLVFPLMPVSIKTPALPIVVAAPHPTTEGEWLADETDGAWRFVDLAQQQRGFVLTGKNTARRMEFSKATSA